MCENICFLFENLFKKLQKNNATKLINAPGYYVEEDQQIEREIYCLGKLLVSSFYAFFELVYILSNITPPFSNVQTDQT